MESRARNVALVAVRRDLGPCRREHVAVAHRAAPDVEPSALDVPVAGVSTLAALAAGAPGAVPVVDARRREVFVLQDGRPQVARPHELAFDRRTVCVGNGAVRYRSTFEAMGVDVPLDRDERHLPRARFHALLADEFGPAEAVEPLYLRLPDADTTVA